MQAPVKSLVVLIVALAVPFWSLSRSTVVDYRTVHPAADRLASGMAAVPTPAATPTPAAPLSAAPLSAAPLGRPDTAATVAETWQDDWAVTDPWTWPGLPVFVPPARSATLAPAAACPGGTWTATIEHHVPVIPVADAFLAAPVQHLARADARREQPAATVVAMAPTMGPTMGLDAWSAVAGWGAERGTDAWRGLRNDLSERLACRWHALATQWSTASLDTRLAHSAAGCQACTDEAWWREMELRDSQLAEHPADAEAQCVALYWAAAAADAVQAWADRQGHGIAAEFAGGCGGSRRLGTLAGRGAVIAGRFLGPQLTAPGVHVEDVAEVMPPTAEVDAGSANDVTEGSGNQSIRSDRAGGAAAPPDAWSRRQVLELSARALERIADQLQDLSRKLQAADRVDYSAEVTAEQATF